MQRCVVSDTVSDKGSERTTALLITNLTDTELTYLQAVIEAGAENYGYEHVEYALAESLLGTLEARLETNGTQRR